MLWASSTELPPKNFFLIAQAKVIIFLYISIYLSDKYSDIVWVYPPSRAPKWTPQKSVFLSAQARALVFL